MPICMRATYVLALSVSLSLCVEALAATSPENTPIAATLDQVNARFARIQQEVDRLRSVGMTSSADDMAQRLQHFRDELAGRAPSLISGSELDDVSMYTGDTGSPVVEIHPTDRPIVLALS